MTGPELDEIRQRERKLTPVIDWKDVDQVKQLLELVPAGELWPRLVSA